MSVQFLFAFKVLLRQNYTKFALDLLRCDFILTVTLQGATLFSW